MRGKKQKLAAELGEEGKNSSYGAWHKAYLETAYANRLVESDYQIMTQESGKVLDNALKQLDNALKPQEAFNLEKQKLEQDRITQQNILNMQREQNINQLNLEQGRLAFQKKLENLRSKQYYDNLNFSVQ